MSQNTTTKAYTYGRATGESYVFDSAGHLIKQLDRNGYATTLAYTGVNLTKVTDPAGRTLTFTYGTNGKVASVTDPVGRKVAYVYNTVGDLTGVTNVAGGKWAFTYNTTHRMLTMTDPRGGKSTNTYDGSGRDTSSINPMKRTTTFAYAGTVGGTESTTETDARGDKTVWNYQNLELTSKTVGLEPRRLQRPATPTTR